MSSYDVSQKVDGPCQVTILQMSWVKYDNTLSLSFSMGRQHVYPSPWQTGSMKIAYGLT
jgi:hypothetical protein